MGVTDIQICLEDEENLNIVEKAELENANHDRNIKQLNHSLPTEPRGALTVQPSRYLRGTERGCTYFRV